MTADMLPELPVMPTPGPTCYQVTVQLPGRRTIVCGATGCRRDWVREDMAALFGCDPKHVAVHAKLPRPAARKAGTQ